MIHVRSGYEMYAFVNNYIYSTVDVNVCEMMTSYQNK